MALNDVVEDDGSIVLIDYGISKRHGTHEEQKQIDAIKALAKGVPSVNRQNTFETNEDNQPDQGTVNNQKSKQRVFVGTYIFASISQLRKEGKSVSALIKNHT